MRCKPFVVVAVMCGTVGWGAVLLAAPFAITHHPPADGQFVAGTATYVVSSALCHQQAARSFSAWGVQLPVCARCSGLYGGAALAALGVLMTLVAGARPSLPHRTARTLILVAAVPTVASFVTEIGGVVDPGNVGRALAGLPLGAAVVWMMGNVSLAATEWRGVSGPPLTREPGDLGEAPDGE